MFFIVLHHCCLQEPLSNTWGGVLLFASTYAAVDCFMAISGWFGIRFSWGKWLRLLGIYLFYIVGLFLFRVVLYGLGILLNEPTPSQHFNWFAAAYLALMLFAPIVNAGLETLAQTPRKLITAWALFALAITLSWASTLTPLLTFLNVNGWGSHTLSTLLFVYVTLRMVRFTNWEERVGKWAPWAFATLWLGFIVYIALWGGIFLEPNGKLSCAQVAGVGYNAPVMWMTAVAAFLFFRRIHPPAWLTRLVCFLGPSMFGIYLFHESPFRQVLYQIPETWLHQQYPWLPVAIIILACTVLTFTVSLCADLTRRAGLSAIRWTWGKVTHTSATDKAPSPRLPD